MLIQFKFKNFKSFKDETTLNMAATRCAELPHHITTIGYEKILKTATIYGANSSGKSNMYEAMEYMVSYVINSFGFNEVRKSYPFLMDKKSKTEPSTFEMFFTLDDTENTMYNYGFSVDNTGILSEWLNSKSGSSRKYSPAFYRSRKIAKPKFIKIQKEHRKNLTVSLRDETLILSLGAKLKIPILEDIYNWFVSMEFLNSSTQTMDYNTERFVSNGFKTNPNMHINITDYLKSFDNSIVDVTCKETLYSTEPNYQFGVVRKIRGLNETVEIPLTYESAGVRKMFMMYPILNRVLTNGSTMFVDSLNTNIHPLLLRNIIITFLNPETNPHNAQLIFTTYDIWPISIDCFRRDEIILVDKDSSGISSLFVLVEFKGSNYTKIRKDENYGKNYISGKYGSIPELKKMIVGNNH